MTASPAPLRLLRAGFPDRPALDTALSRALLLRVSEGALGPTLRLYRTGRVVSFGRFHQREPGYPEGVAAARAQGYAAVQRLVGGRAAIFHEGTLGFGHALALEDPRS